MCNLALLGISNDQESGLLIQELSRKVCEFSNPNSKHVHLFFFNVSKQTLEKSLEFAYITDFKKFFLCIMV